jgi:hypothetical protein
MMRHRDHLVLDVKATLVSAGLSMGLFGAVYTPLYLGDVNETWSLAIAAVIAVPIAIGGRWSFVVVDRLARYDSQRDELLEQLMKTELTLDEIERLINSLESLPEEEQEERERYLVSRINDLEVAHRDVRRVASELFALHRTTPAQRAIMWTISVRHRYRRFLYERSRRSPSWLWGQNANVAGGVRPRP